MNPHLLLALGLSLICLTQGATAGERHRSGGYQGERTQGTWQRHSERSPGQIRRSTDWQSERGAGHVDSHRQWNRTDGSAQRERQITRPDGSSADWQRNRQRNDDGSYRVTGSGTDFQGRDTGLNRTVGAKEADGTRVIHSERERSDGKSLTTDARVQGGDGGRQIEGSYETSDGRSGTYTGEAHRGPEGRQLDQTLTTAEGQSITRSVTTERTPEGGDRSVTVTGPDGQSRTRTGGYSLDDGQ